MTYCIGVLLDDGVVLASDSRTNAGIDRVSTFRKMHILEKPGERFFAMVIPEQYGGLGFSAAAHSAVVVKIASRSVTAAVTVMVPNSLGPAELLLRYGTEQQKREYLPRLASGADLQ